MLKKVENNSLVCLFIQIRPGWAILSNSSERQTNEQSKKRQWKHPVAEEKENLKDWGYIHISTF